MKTNYHTHTARCNHAVGEDADYAKEALKSGYDILGYSDHGPLPEGHASHMRMTFSQRDGYIASVKQIKEDYKGKLDVRLGFEYEYFPAFFSFMKEQKEALGIDYYILGNHYDTTETGFYFGFCEDKAQIARYTEMTVRGMETGMYSYLAHPDLYLLSYPEFDEHAKAAAYTICRAAHALNMPLEWNLYGVEKQQKRPQGVGYPCKEFWRIAAEENCTAIIGVDAHDPAFLSTPLYTDAVKSLAALAIPRLERLG